MSRGIPPILVVDAEQTWIDFCTAALKDGDYQVYTAHSIGEALRMLASAAWADQALVLTDAVLLETDEIALPKLAGTDQDAERSVTVMFSAALTPDRARQAFKHGASDCVRKPYDATSLLVLVEQMLRDHRIAAASERTPIPMSSRILVVEDDEDWMVSLVRYLPPADEIAQAKDYESAVRELSERDFDLVVMDLRLVDADDRNFQGMDLVRLVRKQDKERSRLTQVIIASAYGTLDHVRESYRTLDVYYYFDKRLFAPSKYREAVAEALRSSGPPM